VRFKLTVGTSDHDRDVLVTADAAATVGDIAEAVAKHTPGIVQVASGAPTIRSHGVPTSAKTSAPVVLDPTLPITDSQLRSGSRITLAASSEHFAQVKGDSGDALAVLRVLVGPDEGREFPLSSGSSYVGRDQGCDIVLVDPYVSKRHVRISVTDAIEVIDLGSANGTTIDGEQVPRAVVRPDDRIEIGNSVFAVQPLVRLTGEGGTAVGFNRPPRVMDPFVGGEVEAPDPPTPSKGMRFPLIALVAPLLLGVVMFLVTHFASNGSSGASSILPFVFIALSPLLMVGSFLDQRRQVRAELKGAKLHFAEAIADMRSELETAQVVERTSRLAEAPSTADGVLAAEELSSLLWSRRTDLPSFLDVRLGIGRTRSRTIVKLVDRKRTTSEFWAQLVSLRRDFEFIDEVPIVAALSASGGLGIAGPDAAMGSVARSLLIQIACLHSPAEVAIMAVGSSTTVGSWDWLKWLPHVGSAHSPVKDAPLANTSLTALRLVSQLEALVEERLDLDAGSRPDGSVPPLPHVVVVVLDDAPIDRSRLVALAETGPKAGVHIVWCAGSVAQIPAACRAFIELDSDGGGEAGFVHTGEQVEPVRCESVDLDVAQHVARRMAPVVDAGARVDDDSDLPRTVSFLASLGTELASASEAVVERWTANDPTLVGDPLRKEGISLRAVVGQGSGDTFALDLRTHGPHALVGGTTGAGKSEFLQTWVLAMAASQSPKRVTFLFVDYKGGSAFASCTELPHCVGLVTDLKPHLVRRALTSLRAELTYREEVLRHYGVKDLVELEKNPTAEQMPSLIIVVDEFAALVQEVPEFVDGVIDVAQRGRSLGLHLVLATQRPSGVIKGNLRANTNLRVALRMADDDDSSDVIGSALAAGFDPGIPGRAAAKTGPGRINVFQSLYVGGATPDVAPRPEIQVEGLNFGVGEAMNVLAPEGAPKGPTDNEPIADIDRVVGQIQLASRGLQIPPPRRPWLDVLAPVYDLQLLPQRSDAELILGMQDEPKRQANRVVHFRPDVDGNMVIIGTGGSGKSTALRTLAVSAAVTPRSGPCDVYALDFGSRGLAMIEDLPHVGAVIAGTDHERVGRLLRWLRSEVDDRSQRYSAAKASTITEYRKITGNQGERRLLILLDGLGAFRQEYEIGPQSAWFTLFGQLAADGRAVGIHFVITADRPGAVPPSLAATIQKRLVLRLSDSNDYGLVGAPADILSTDSAPGRGVLDGLEVQIAVLGASASLPKQADSMSSLGAQLVKQQRVPASPIERLSERILLSDLVGAVRGLPVIAVSDETLKPVTVAPSGVFYIVGPPSSGTTSSLATLVRSTRSAHPDGVMYLIAGPRTTLTNLTDWTSRAIGEDEVGALAAELEAAIRKGRVTSTPESPATIVIEGIQGFVGGLIDGALESLVKVAVEHDLFVIGEAAQGAVESWGLGQVFKQARRGVALQPDDQVGFAEFKTEFPRLSRSEFPPGRGILVDAGRTSRVQMCLPE
jgi:S-DNA-T family DNA segregation ATPase FtsK/SpoIIIE